MTGFVILTSVLVVWLLWDEIHDAAPRRRRNSRVPPVTIVGEHPYMDLDAFLATLRPGDVIVSQNGVEVPVAANWTPGDIVRLLSEVESL